MSHSFRKIFVVYPRGVRTGGPEALHQLVSTLRALGQDAYLVPDRGTEQNERVTDYSHYDAPESPVVEDRIDNAVVVPEYAMYELARFSYATPYCWWLSIDNSPLFRSERRAVDDWTPHLSGLPRLREVAESGIYRVRNLINKRTVLKPKVRHLTQSHYAWSFLYARLNVLSALVTDYTPLDALHSINSVPITERGRTIAYNPRKAAHITSLLRNYHPDAEYLPLEGMTPKEVAHTLGRTTIYLDLGNHPGKDRMPREAAICGAVTLVARRGAGAYFSDVPIPDDHKIAPTARVLEDTVRAIERVFSDPQREWKRQASYREAIEDEQRAFAQEVRSAFVAPVD